jgi:hypothetical protein
MILNRARVFRHTKFNVMGYRATADVVEIGRNRVVAIDFERLARRVLLIDDAHDGMVGVKAGERRAIANCDCLS